MAVMYDIAVIGGGVVGCTVLNELTQHGLSCILCERNTDLVAEASSGNSAIAHTGFHVQTESIEERQCLKTARKLNQECFNKYNIPYKQIGATVVAWTNEELKKLPNIVQQARENGITNVFQISKEQLQQKEPNLSHDALGAVCIPEEAIVDSWLFPIMMAHTAKLQGAKILLGCNLLNASQDSDNGHWLLITNTGQFRARAVINCAGLYGDIVEKINKTPSFQIYPRKGQFIVYDNQAASLLNSIIFHTPTDERTMGILLFPTVYGNLVVGPTAEEQPNRDKWPINIYTSQMLESHALRMLPSLSKHSIVTTYAGLRPATQYRDYQLQTHVDRNWITVGGIRSTGVSAATGIAKYVSQQVQKVFGIFPHVTSEQLLLQNRQCGAVAVARQLSQEENKEENDGNWKHLVNQGRLALDDATYHITHPLSRLGLDPFSKL